ncbi:MAG TPA: NADH-quinone oxidoreductase subunit NuoH, partial [bacterium]|nr:NADH-quinone oxidoreductase subunit NuoH [bacterium]
ALNVIFAFMCANVMAAFVTVTALVLTLGERKVCAWFQNRKGPNRVGPWGLLQPVADVLKLLQKEDLVPNGADQAVFKMAPYVGMIATYMVLAILPYDKGLSIIDLNVGVLYITAVSGLGVLSILMGGWSSNNKYSLLGGLRSAAQIVSYELSPALVVLSVVLFSGTLSVQGIVREQASGWNLWAMGPMGVLGLGIYLIAGTAEINRAPFDLPEAESELTAGYHTEYSGMRFSMFQLAEFMNMFIIAALTATLFLGGWQPLVIAGHRLLESTGPDPLDPSKTAVLFAMPGYVYFFAKTTLVMFVIMWFRWTFPRVRVDQLMKLEWKILLPLSFVNLLAVALWTAVRFSK